MPVTGCQVCGSPFLPAPLLRFPGLPGAAQYLPDEASLARDRGVELTIRQCAGCGLVQTDTDPVPYYREVIRAAGESPEMRAYRREQFGDFVERHDLKGKKVIEIGCGRGEYLSLLVETGAAARGLEYGTAAVADARAAGLEIMPGFVDGPDYDIPGAPYAAFFMLSFLEHLPDPGATLRGIAGNLAEDGIGLVEVPNFDMIVRQGLFSEFISDHLLYFTRETLATALNLNGYDVLDCQETWYDYLLSAVVRRRPPLDVAGFEARRDEVCRELNDYVARFGPKKVAVWGAGHQALAVIALAKLGDAVRYVVDSAPFKQGRYTPATHLPIVPPDRLNSDPVEAVIVMAGSYSDEVAGIIRRTHGSKMAVAILREDGLEVEDSRR